MRVPSREEFNNLAGENPNALLTWIQSGELKPGFLTYALESLGSVHLPVLEELLEATTHESAVVREGAIYGLSVYFSRIKDALENLVGNDSSVGVREAAREVLEG